jgi:hypothetical protein
MPKPCSICVSEKRDDIECAVMNRISVRETARTFGVSASAVTRHREHAGLVPGEVSNSGKRSHVTVAEELIEAVRVIRGTDFSAQDAAEAQHLLSVAQSAEADPTIAALRELRLTLDQFRKLSFHTDQSETEEYGKLMARFAPHPHQGDGTYQRVYYAALEAGATSEAAMAAAQAATSWAEEDYPSPAG